VAVKLPPPPPPPPEASAKERVPEPFVVSTWSAVPSEVGSVKADTKLVRLLS